MRESLHSERGASEKACRAGQEKEPLPHGSGVDAIFPAQHRDPEDDRERGVRDRASCDCGLELQSKCGGNMGDGASNGEYGSGRRGAA